MMKGLINTSRELVILLVILWAFPGSAQPLDRWKQEWPDTDFDRSTIDLLEIQPAVRALALPERLSLKMHVIMCSACRNFSRHIPFLHDAMRAYAEGRDEEKSES